VHYLLLYDYVPDILEKRGPHRAAHLAAAQAAVERGDMVLAGALNPPEGAVLLFRGDSPQVAESFAVADPYVQNGLVTSWRIKEWTTVVGPGAEAPVSRQSAEAPVSRQSAEAPVISQ